MSILDSLDDIGAWTEYRQYKVDKGHLTTRELEWLDAFIAESGYVEPARAARESTWPLPTKRLINKLGKPNKRVVYRFPDAENWVLKLIAWKLFAYDCRQPEGCYSFRRNYGAQRAIRELCDVPGIGKMWCYKADISNYFNSIPIELLQPVLTNVIDDDEELLGFLMRLLSEHRALSENEDSEDGAGFVIDEPRGVMAGTPISPFLANIFLSALDEWFVSRGVPYARYSDDIVIFANSKAELDAYRREFLRLIAEHGLVVNPDKEAITEPGTPWEFLGVSICGEMIDLSRATKTKLKGKIRRKARALRRWMLRKDAEPEVAMRALIRVFNRKFFAQKDPNDLTWARWFFPLLTTSDGLHEVDQYLQAYIRYVPTGRFTKANYSVSYDDLKCLGYSPLVHEYYSATSVDPYRGH